MFLEISPFFSVTEQVSLGRNCQLLPQTIRSIVIVYLQAVPAFSLVKTVMCNRGKKRSEDRPVIFFRFKPEKT